MQQVAVLNQNIPDQGLFPFISVSLTSAYRIEQRLCFFRKMNSFAKEFVKNS
jgi:hypothetical protein